MKITSLELDEVFPVNPLREVAFEVRFPLNLRINSEIHVLQSAFEDHYPLADHSTVETEDGGFRNVYIFEDQIKSRQIKVSEEDLVITFRKYKSFENYLEEVLHNTEILSNCASIKYFTRVGLRYVNFISNMSATNGFEFLKVFLKPPISLEYIEQNNLQQFIAEFVLQKESCFLNSRNIYYQQFEKETDDLPDNIYVLDIDAFVGKKVEREKLGLIVKELHHEIQIEFLSRISDSYKEYMRKTSKP